MNIEVDCSIKGIISTSIVENARSDVTDQRQSNERNLAVKFFRKGGKTGEYVSVKIWCGWVLACSCQRSTEASELS